MLNSTGYSAYVVLQNCARTLSVCCLYISAWEARKIDIVIFQVEFDIT
jgi:hypothetical protein